MRANYKSQGLGPNPSTKENPMAHVISDDCSSCGACVAVCPVECIEEGEGKYIIDADACIDCGACIGECPIGAIAAE